LDAANTHEAVDVRAADKEKSHGAERGITMPGFTAELFSGIAVAVSGYSLWQTTLRGAELRVFVPPLIRYASPYQNSTFEVFEIPLTIVNQGARTGTVLSLDLEVTNPQTGASKQFYSAGLGPWSVAKVHGEGLVPFAPFSLAGRASHSATILFYAREDSRILQIAEAPGQYQFALSLLTAHRSKGKAKPLEFKMNLPYMDHRAFTSGAGTLPLHQPEWRSAGGGL
jgi:hypothetical protein